MQKIVLPPLFDIPMGFMIREKESKEYSIELPILPFVFDAEEITTSIKLDRTDFKTANPKYLSEKKFDFPTNPQPGYIDASVYLGGIHNYVDVTKICFSKILEYHEISFVSVTFEMYFELELIELENTHRVVTTNVIIYNRS